MIPLLLILATAALQAPQAGTRREARGFDGAGHRSCSRALLLYPGLTFSTFGGNPVTFLSGIANQHRVARA